MLTSGECAESLSRRSFLFASAILTFGALPDLSFGAEVNAGRLLVILLRGGMDGLCAMPPIGDSGLKGRRQHLMPDGLLPLDGFFALHPALKNLHTLYTSGQALLVHGVSNPYTGRSHFEGQDIMESGALLPYSSATGWLGRALDASGYQAVAMSLPVPLILRGKTESQSTYPSWISNPPPSLYALLQPLWANDADFAAVSAQFGMGAPAGYEAPPQMGQEVYLSELAQQAGMRLRQSDGPRVAVIDHVGFDTHASEPGEYGDKLTEVDAAIGAFHTAIGDDVWKETLVVTVTEFGRTVAENGSYGTDHGWGTSIFVAGGRLNKAGIVADWPGLKPANLYQGRDLKATLDSRSLYAAVLSASLGLDPELIRQSVLENPQDDRFSPFLS